MSSKTAAQHLSIVRMLPSIFIKARLVLLVDNQSIDYGIQDISVFGASGLSWGNLEPKKYFSRRVSCIIQVAAAQELIFRPDAYLLREQTIQSQTMGLKFDWSPEDREILEHYIIKHGFYPTLYARKYPRIPAQIGIQTFPTRVLLTLIDLAGRPTIDQPLIFDVANLSPSGILISSENRSTLDIKPSQRVKITLEPRGWFPTHVQLQGTVARVSDDINFESDNLIRYLGIRFSNLDAANRVAFLELLRDILEKIRKLSPPTPR